MFTSITHLLVVLNKFNETRENNKSNSELKDIIVTKPTISRPIQRRISTKRQGELELQELKIQRALNKRHLPPLPKLSPNATHNIQPTPTQGNEVKIFSF